MPKCILCQKFYLFNIDRNSSICNKCKKKENCIDINSMKPIKLSFSDGNIEPYIPDPFANIPDDVIKLLWFLDGTRKNFTPKSYYANTSIPLTIKIPDCMSVEAFKTTGNSLLQNAYQKTKDLIKARRKKSC